MTHRVSVIVPAWNMARFLPDALASVPDVHEIIIVAAAESSDDTREVANALARNRPGVSVLLDPNKGPAVARNIGIRAASGDVIAFIDADDVWPKGKLATQLARLDREPRADVVAGLVTYFDKLDRSALAPAEGSRTKTVFVHHVAAMVYRRSVFDMIGPFDESLLYAEDGDLLMRIIEADLRFVILQTPTLYYRRHGDSMMTRDDPRKMSDFARSFALSLARRRKLGLSMEPLAFDRFYEPVPG